MFAKKYKTLIKTAGACCLILFVVSNPAFTQNDKKWSGLIVTGQSPHNGNESSSALEIILENTGLFTVDTAVCESGQEAEFSPEFSGYDLVIINYSGPSWPQSARNALEQYVENGGGLVIYHTSGSSFPEWDSYAVMAGLSGGESRSRKSGPYVFWKEGRIIRDDSPGKTGQASLLHAFPVAVREPFHPIMRGIPSFWMHANDRIMGLLRGPAENLTVLATAYSDPFYSGTGRHEPVIFSVRYGQGRIFHTTLGGAEGKPPFPALECAGFIAAFQRGSEWAASGRVTQEVPADFPAVPDNEAHPDKVRTWKKYTAPRIEDILNELAEYREGRNDEIVLKLRDYIYIRRHSPEALRVCEKKLAAFLDSEAALTGKMIACRHLRTIGTSNSVPALRNLLFLENAADEARYALEEIPGEDADEAFIEALDRFEGDKRLGIISSMGSRTSSRIIRALIRVFDSGEQPYSDAAALALGRIGRPEAADALCRVVRRDKGDARPAAVYGLLNAVQFGVKYDCFEDAGGVYERLQSFDLPLIIRQAAVRGWIITHPQEAEEYILDILREKEAGLHAAAAEMIPEVFTERSAERLVPFFQTAPDSTQVMLLHALGQFDVSAVRSAALTALESPAPAVRIASLKALKQIGNENTVDPVARHAASSEGEEKEAARECLANMQGPDIDQAVLTGFVKAADPAVKKTHLQAVKDRNIEKSRTLLLEAVTDESSEISAMAADVFRNFAEPKDLPVLLQIYLNLREEAVRTEMRKTIAAAAVQIEPSGERGNLIGEKYSETRSEEEKAALIQLLPLIGDNSTLTHIREALNSTDENLRETAVEALADWPGTTPVFDLKRIAETGENSLKIRALRGYIRMLGDNPHISPAAAVSRLREARNMAERPEELRLILGILPVFASPEALDLALSLKEVSSVKEEARVAAEKIREIIENR